MSKATVLLTGGSGFIGRHVLQALLHAGQEVIAAEHRTRLPEPWRSRCAQVVAGPLDSPAVGEALEKANAVVHLAAYIPTDYASSKEADACLRVNTLATLRLAEAAAARGCRFVYLSTANMYLPSAVACHETHPIYPLGRAAYYFASKLAGECYAQTALTATGCAALVLRVGTPYGPGEPSGKVIPAFLRRAARGEPLTFASDGHARFNFVYVTDVAECVAAAASRGESGIYNVCSGESTSLAELARALAAAFPERHVYLAPRPATGAEATGFPPIDITRMRQTWGLAPIGIEEGVLRYRRNLEAAVQQQ
jgi:UDP-glucose 4-epimerase